MFNRIMVIYIFLQNVHVSNLICGDCTMFCFTEFLFLRLCPGDFPRFMKLYNSRRAHKLHGTLGYAFMYGLLDNNQTSKRSQILKTEVT